MPLAFGERRCQWPIDEGVSVVESENDGDAPRAGANHSAQYVPAAGREKEKGDGRDDCAEDADPRGRQIDDAADRRYGHDCEGPEGNMAAGDRTAEEKWDAERNEGRETVPVADGKAEPAHRAGQQLGDVPLLQAAGEEATDQGEDDNTGDPQGKPVEPSSRVVAPRPGHNHREYRNVEHHARELAVGARRVCGPEDREERPEAERGKEPAGEPRSARSPRERPDAEPHAEDQHPPQDDRERVPGRLAEAAVVVGDEQHDDRDGERYCVLARNREEALRRAASR